MVLADPDKIPHWPGPEAPEDQDYGEFAQQMKEFKEYCQVCWGLVRPMSKERWQAIPRIPVVWADLGTNGNGSNKWAALQWLRYMSQGRSCEDAWPTWSWIVYQLMIIHKEIEEKYGQRTDTGDI